MSEPMTAFLTLSALCVAYFLPMLIAGFRNHPQFGPIAILTVFGGWTLLLWIVALAWAVSAKTEGRT